MLHLLGTIPFLPLLAFGGRMRARTISLVGTLSTGAAAILATAVAVAFIISPPPGRVFSQLLWAWLQIDDFAPRIALYLDPLSLVMMLVVAWVSFFILVYSTEFMRGDEGYRRFFAYMNLFVFSMLVLVLADNFLFLMVGWEGVGLSSYLLIGFWYRDPVNGAAARKAFIVTRVGDTALLVGLMLIFTKLGSLNIQGSMGLAQQHWADGSGLATAAALLILGGALGKSAQLPLQTWLPDAMAGPTPVSALIHAATMVTAGVYLVARTHVFFELSPAARLVVAVIGAATLLYAGFCALAQRDIKRVLAYSTISQIGYMFLALGVAAWSAAIFHFMVHAFFKALLFLGAGLVIKAMGEEHDIYKMGSLRHDQPLVFWTFLAGAASLAAVPGVTAGFYSKDLIISSTLTSAQGSAWLWAAAVVGAFLTSLYAFRLVFVVFFGKPAEGRAPAALRFGRAALVPVVILAALAVCGGWIRPYLPISWGLPCPCRPRERRDSRPEPGRKSWWHWFHWWASTSPIYSSPGDPLPSTEPHFLRRSDVWSPSHSKASPSTDSTPPRSYDLSNGWPGEAKTTSSTPASRPSTGRPSDCTGSSAVAKRVACAITWPSRHLA